MKVFLTNASLSFKHSASEGEKHKRGVSKDSSGVTITLTYSGIIVLKFGAIVRILLLLSCLYSAHDSVSL